MKAVFSASSISWFASFASSTPLAPGPSSPCPIGKTPHRQSFGELTSPLHSGHFTRAMMCHLSGTKETILGRRMVGVDGIPSQGLFRPILNH